MSNNDRWNVSRFGTAARVTTPAQSVPQYGLVSDLATGTSPYLSGDQYAAMMRDIATRTASQSLAADPSMQSYQNELERAQNYQDSGYGLPDKELNKGKDAVEGLLGGHISDLPGAIMAGVDVFKTKAVEIGGGTAEGISDLFGGDPETHPDGQGATYEKYRLMGGILSQKDFEDFEPATQAYLVNRAESMSKAADVADTPGVHQALTGLGAIYRGAETPFIIWGHAGHKNPLLNATDPMWFKGGTWAKAWRESQDQSFGNALINAVAEPYVGRDRIAEWKRNSALYDLTSMGVEIGAGWYADPLVISGKVAGGASRFARFAAPINENSKAFEATTQALQREQITVRGLPGAYGRVQASRMQSRWGAVKQYAQDRPFGEFSQLRMFRHRQAEGYSAASALHWVFNEAPESGISLPEFANLRTGERVNLNYPDMETLTQQIMHGDPKAWQDFNALKDAAPEEINKFAPGAQTYMDAIESIKTGLPQLQKEADELAKVEPKSPFHEWSLHTEIDQRVQDIAEQQELLSKYQGYDNWYDSINREPKVQQVDARKRFFMDNQFGKTHAVLKWTKPLWIQKANIAEIHDVDSGAMSITRQFQQFDHLFGYRNPEALDFYLQRWINAPTPYDRYETMHQLERNELMNAAAQKFDVKPEVIEAVYDKMVAEQNKVLAGIVQGDEPLYSTAPNAIDRLKSGDQNISLVNHDPDTGMVELNLMDNGSMHTVHVHESALAPAGPIDPTQTVNYYRPVDTRRFYLELKRNRDVIENMNHVAARNGAATLATMMDGVGTKFNQLWKPLVLFRFGWPQRVLIDERMRAMAVLGIPQFTKYYGSNDARVLNNVMVRSTDAINNMFNALVRGPKWADKAGREKFNIGPGPIAEDAKESATPFVLDQEEQRIPLVPEVYSPVFDPARHEKIAGHVAAWDKYHDDELRHEAWTREALNAGAEGKSSFFDRAAPPPLRFGDRYVERSFGTKDTKANPIQARAVQSMNLTAPVMPEHPIFDIFHKHTIHTKETRVYDPISTIREKSGLAVPLEHTRIRPSGSGPSKRGFFQTDDLVKWYKDNAELLASTGHRILMDEDGSLAIARVLPNRQSRKAREIAEFVNAGRVHNLRTGKTFHLKSWNDLTPTMEAAKREFRFEEGVERQRGEAPFEGPKRLTKQNELYHGSHAKDLADRPLGPRDEASWDNGRMMGDGFYTTTEKDIADGYGNHPFVLKGSRDGRTYKIFDLEREVSAAERKRLQAWVGENMPEHANDIAALLRAYDAGEIGGLVGNGKTWANMFAHMYGEGTKALTRYLEEVHGAGVITHSSGNAGGIASRTFIWLDPENLLIKPLWTKNGVFQPVERFLTGPDGAHFNPVPENRILRTGVRNPMFRELHQNHAALEARRAELGGKRKLVDPEVVERMRRERSMMDALGLQYKRDVEGYHGIVDQTTVENPSPLGADWYVMTDPEKFGRVHDEALAQNAEVEKTAQINGELRSQERAVEDANFDADIDDVHNSFLRRIWRRRESGTGYVTVKSADGEEVHYPSAYEGHRGAIMRSLVSSKGAMEQLSEGHGAGTSMFRRRAVGHKAYNPPVMDDAARTVGTPENRQALEYFDAWTNLLNSQIAHSPIWNKMLNGWSDAKVVHWLENTPEGAGIRRDMKHEYRDTELWVNEHRAKLDYYLPNKKLQRLLGKGRVKASDLRHEIHEEQYPDVFGPDVEFLDKRSEVGQFLSVLADRAWHALGTAPIDTFSRHPFARSMYDLKMRSLISTTDSKWLDGKTLERFERESRKYAKEQVRRTLWDLTDQTNFADALRFIAPFWGAQLEAISKWARIISDRPETIGRWFVLGNAVNQNYRVVNEDGETVHRPLYSYHPTDRVVVRVPEVLRKTGLGKALETIGSVGIPFGSANTVLQGEEPLLPGPGPIVTIPADKLMRAMSDTYMTQFNDTTLYRWLFPIGRPQHGGLHGVLDQVSPGWAKRVSQFSEGDRGIAYANLMTETAREMELSNRKRGLPPPTPKQIENQAAWVWMLRIATGLVAPTQMQFRPKHQFFIDEWHRYEKNYGIDAFDKFVKDYGNEMARYAESSSNSTVGIPPTAKGMEEWSQNKDLIQKYQDWGDAIISPDAHSGEFDSDAYYAQFQINVGPGDDTPLRESQSQTERFKDSDTKLGWQEYRKVDAIIDVELQQRGLHSIQQTGAEDLAQAKQNFIADLTQRNPSWRADYDNFNNNIYTRVHELEQWAFKPQFDKRPDIKGVRQYLMIRDQVAKQLDAYAASTGGSRSLNSEENGALRQWFYTQVGALAQANPAFAEFYSRYLSGDTLEQGSGGF